MILPSKYGDNTFKRASSLKKEKKSGSRVKLLNQRVGSQKREKLISLPIEI